MINKYPLMNAYWEDKIARLENIDVPAYVVASWTNPLHDNTCDAFRRISSQNKWLRVHNTQEWSDYYAQENVEDLRRFFDRYMKGIENGWEQTPCVRLSILDPGGKDVVNRPENEFPPVRTQYRKLYLDGRLRALSPEPVAEEFATRYKADDGKGQAVFTIRFDNDTELTGHMKLRLWVESAGGNDMDLFVKIQKLGKRGNLLSSRTMAPSNPVARTIIHLLRSFGVQKVSPLYFTGSKGRLRVSRRQIDSARSTPSEPHLKHRVEELLSPGQMVPVDIPIWPLGMRWHKGEQLRLIVAGYNLTPVPLPGIIPPELRNRGEHILHTGGRFDSHLLVPVVS